jgi:drug/metabolite transporter (DMT)-like permease
MLALAWLGIVQVGLSYALLAAGVRRVRAFEASILLLAEPVLSTLWAWLVFAERPGGLALAGCAIVLVAGVFTVRSDGAADSR